MQLFEKIVAAGSSMPLRLMGQSPRYDKKMNATQNPATGIETDR